MVLTQVMWAPHFRKHPEGLGDPDAKTIEGLQGHLGAAAKHVGQLVCFSQEKGCEKGRALDMRHVELNACFLDWLMGSFKEKTHGNPHA